MPKYDWTAIDLFAGCGGLTTGLVQAGFKVIAAIENNSGAAEAYRLNHPTVAELYEHDIRQLKGTRLLRDLGLKKGQLDLLAGCPPCQGFSRMSTLNGAQVLDDERNDLVLQYLRLVRDLRPRSLMFENVPGLLADHRYMRLKQSLKHLGYLTSEAIHDAANFGVPQRRKRLILLGGLGFCPTLPEPRPDRRRTVRTAISKLKQSGMSGDPVHDVTENRSAAVLDLIRRIPTDGGSRNDLSPEFTLACHIRCDGFFDVYGRMKWDDVSPTITSGFVNPSKGRFLHPEENRCVTPREAAILQTFPRHYKFPIHRGKYPVATMIGNAFPPMLAKCHAAAVAKALSVMDGAR